MHWKQRQTSAVPGAGTAAKPPGSRPVHKNSHHAVRYVLLFVLGLTIGYGSSQLQLKGGSSTVHVRVQQDNRRLPQGVHQPHALAQPQRPPVQTLAANGQLYIATAANSAYFLGLTNLIGSIRYWCPECHVLVYNLGLIADELDTVRGWCNVTLKWEGGVSGAAHQKSAKTYAWKPLAILDAVDAYKRVLWLDAGSTVTAPLRNTVWPLLLQDGHFLVQGQDADMVPWCHDLTWQYFKLDKNTFHGKPSYSGNTIGFVYDSPAYHKILKPWVECAAVKACIAPPGTSRANHRFDQSVLSIITYTAGLNVTAHTELLLASGVPCFEAQAGAVWSSRRRCRCYLKFAGNCSAAAHLGQGYLPPYPGRRRS